jgi:hypothetical protein
MESVGAVVGPLVGVGNGVWVGPVVIVVVDVAVDVAVEVAVDVAVEVAVEVGVEVGVEVAVGVAVEVAVGVATAWVNIVVATSTPSPQVAGYALRISAAFWAAHSNGFAESSTSCTSRRAAMRSSDRLSGPRLARTKQLVLVPISPNVGTFARLPKMMRSWFSSTKVFTFILHTPDGKS